MINLFEKDRLKPIRPKSKAIFPIEDNANSMNPLQIYKNEHILSGVVTAAQTKIAWNKCKGHLKWINEYLTWPFRLGERRGGSNIQSRFGNSNELLFLAVFIKLGTLVKLCQQTARRFLLSTTQNDDKHSRLVGNTLTTAWHPVTR